MANSLLEALRMTREGYDKECAWHKFLMDAYTGTGGFEGMIKQPASGFWGPASEVYANVRSTLRDYGEIDSYLDKYPREDDPKYRARVNATVYCNYIEPLTDLKVSHLLRKPFEYREIPEQVAAWMQDVDGQGTAWSEIRADVVLRAAVLGWFPMVADARPGPVDENGEPIAVNRAQADELGMQPYPVQLFPSQLLDYDCDDAGNIVFAKVRSDITRRDSWEDKPTPVEVYTIWTPTRWEKYEVTKAQSEHSAMMVDEGDNPFGVVPVVPFRCKAAMGDHVKGSALHAAASKAAKSLYNRTSEYTEHLRGQVFAVLVVATKGGQLPEDLTVGTDNALPVDADGSQSHQFLAPPASVAATYEKRLETEVREIYRLARVEFTREGGQTASGLARAYEFAQTNRALADFAAEIAKAELAMLDLVARYYGVSDDERLAMQVVAPQSFDIEDLQADIQSGLDLITAQIGPTATKMIKLQLVEQRLRNMPPGTRDVIESELDDEAALADQIDRFDAGPLNLPDVLSVGSPESEAADDITTELEAGA